MKYMGSKNRIAKFILPIMIEEANKKGITTWVEPLCLHETTTIFTENGIKTLAELNIGDFIYSDECKLVEVINKIESPLKEGLSIKLAGNVIINTTEQHKFYLSNGRDVNASEIKIGDSLLTGIDLHNSTDVVIDLAMYVNKSDKSKRGSRGGSVYDNKVRIVHNSPLVNRFITLTPDVCWAVGLVIAEGTKSTITLHKKESALADRFISIYSKILGIEFNQKMYYVNETKNSLTISIPYPKIYEVLFFKAIGIGYGCRNKNMSIGFKLSCQNLISLIKGMHAGDGSLCSNKGYYSWNYKTTSRTLAKQLQTLLSLKLHIKSTLSYGRSKLRYIDGRLLNESDYYNISIGRITDIITIAENNICLDNYTIFEKSNGFVVKDISKSYGIYYDITLSDDSSHKFIIDGGIVTHNCGGGNIIDKVPNTFKRIGIDYNPHTIAALIAIRDLVDKLPNSLTEEEYKQLKGSEPNPIKSWLRFVASFGGKFDSGYAREDGSDETTFVGYGKRNAQKQSPNLQGVQLICDTYENYSHLENCLIYCDPQYEGTTSYKTGAFDHTKFWNWCRKMSEKNSVFVSEYKAPDDFICVWEGEVKTNFASQRNKATHVAVEKLFKISPTLTMEKDSNLIDVLTDSDYWKQRCLLAEKCLDESPCDQDVTMEQLSAWKSYHNFINSEGNRF